MTNFTDLGIMAATPGAVAALAPHAGLVFDLLARHANDHSGADDEVLLWSDTPYTFLKRQSSLHSGKWTRLEQSVPTTVGTVNGN